MFIAGGVPPLGYKTYFLVPADGYELLASAGQLNLDVPDPAKPKRTLGSDQGENEIYRVTVDRATGRISVFDKDLDRVVAKDMEIAASEERGGDTLSNERPTGRTAINSVSRVEVEENNPVRCVVRIDGRIAGVPVTQRLSLSHGLKRIDLENVVDWQQGQFLKIEQVIPYEQPGAQIRYGIPRPQVQLPRRESARRPDEPKRRGDHAGQPLRDPHRAPAHQLAPNASARTIGRASIASTHTRCSGSSLGRLHSDCCRLEWPVAGWRLFPLEIAAYSQLQENCKVRGLVHFSAYTRCNGH